jgi:hypothetical protein
MREGDSVDTLKSRIKQATGIQKSRSSQKNRGRNMADYKIGEGSQIELTINVVLQNRSCLLILINE